MYILYLLTYLLEFENEIIYFQDAIDDLKEDLQEKTDKFNQDIKKTGDKIKNDFMNIFHPKQPKFKVKIKTKI